MLIVGAGGFAKELIQVFHDLEETEGINFYDDTSKNSIQYIFEKYKILKTKKEVKVLFKNTSNKFVLGLGNPILRKTLSLLMNDLGGNLMSAISPKANIGSYNVQIGRGTTILSGANISNNSKIGIGCLIYYNVAITHDCEVGDYVEISPGASILGNVVLGDNCQIGAGAVILPNITLGNNVVVGAGSVVTKSFEDDLTVIGVPARILKK